MIVSGESKPQGVKRNDPDPRPVEGALNRVGVIGQDPGKHYVWVSSVNDPTMNPGSYLNMGYRFTQFEKDAEQPVLGYNPNLKQGDRIEGFGCVLMECSKEHKEMIDAKGAPGAGLGREWADKLQKTIRERDAIDQDEKTMSPNERARMRGITTKRWNDDDRATWSF